ncbi:MULTISPECIES: thioredoxin-disulfide reductase [Prochlorococcus]|uniref:Thioredoxin reductase n=1 Tax=Prochlorococcus marinus (strain SARG / CCMP1375 / SS120) TaxID=167539 RepID=Q7VB53_PROMA|nr:MULTISPECIES: thioredoxin-disulfide reductase [Prochlorococcus]AAQ00290.1 Thioredoxin reductase [Prochlorococcus marinus subsp. marinus str. CCMP1375]KGG14102.1 Thioredoxin reductase [Prochlorococcus marinus str. LG]KGG20730.1 Thioredoxin reductase [Prochlorococcus marinus str. SS2]KGG25131.1 Thioredoxin reductase [Prochlorococcus marinus str. SS35]KGG33317.1 Thioredoxin reductase [Prochlorococcus marinus str. SS51]
MSIENLVIIGSGPAGYTAAIYAARANLQPLLITGFERGGIPGGQLMTTTFVENFPGFPDGIMGPDLMDLLKAQAIRWGTKLLELDAEAIDLKQNPFRVKTANQSIAAQALIIATGARANKLGIPNENKFWTRGISACAICDGATPQFRNEELAVVGGGDSACEEAVYLTKYGSHVHLLIRSNQLKASKAMSDRVMANSQITVHWETELIDVEGKEWIETLKVKRRGTKQEETIKAKGLFYAIGHTPNADLLEGQLLINQNGYISTKSGRPETSIEGVFAAGDVADAEWRQGITAAGSGCKAALAAERWLSRNNLSTLIKRDSIEPAKTDKETEIAISTEQNFDATKTWQKGSYALRKLYHESSKPILVVYTSPNCGPCHVLKPQLKRVIQELKGTVQGIEIDIDIEQEIAKQAGVNGTPTVQLFHQKELKTQWRGVKQRSEFKEAITKVLSK